MIACGEVNNAKDLGLQSSYAIDNLLDVRNGLSSIEQVAQPIMLHPSKSLQSAPIMLHPS